MINSENGEITKTVKTKLTKMTERDPSWIPEQTKMTDDRRFKIILPKSRIWYYSKELGVYIDCIVKYYSDEKQLPTIRCSNGKEYYQVSWNLIYPFESYELIKDLNPRDKSSTSKQLPQKRPSEAISTNTIETETTIDLESLLMNDLNYSDLNLNSLTGDPLVSELYRSTFENDEIVYSDQTNNTNSITASPDIISSETSDNHSTPINAAQDSMQTQEVSNNGISEYSLGQQLMYHHNPNLPYLYLYTADHNTRKNVFAINSETGKISSFLAKNVREMPKDHRISDIVKVSGDLKIILPKSYVLYRHPTINGLYYPCVVTTIKKKVRLDCKFNKFVFASWVDVFPIEYLENLPKPFTVNGLPQAGLTVENLRNYIKSTISKDD